MALLLPTGPTILPSGHSWCDTAPLGSTGFHSQTLQYYHTSHLTPHTSHLISQTDLSPISSRPIGFMSGALWPTFLSVKFHWRCLAATVEMWRREDEMVCSLLSSIWLQLRVTNKHWRTPHECDPISLSLLPHLTLAQAANIENSVYNSA